jgi:hypothetical protein
VVGVVGPTAFDQHILAIAIDLAVVVTLRRAATIGVSDGGIPRSLPRECLGTEAVPVPPFHPSARQQLDQVAVSPSLQQAGQTDRGPDDMTAGRLVDPDAADQRAKPLMFSAGLEIDIALFRRAQTRSIIFGLFTTAVPLLFGRLLGLGFGYALIPAIVVGSLLASHTLLSVPIVQRLGVIRLEPIVVTIGATVLSDTLSLIVFAVCVSTYATGFSPQGLAIQLIEIAVFVPLILSRPSRNQRG